MVKRGCRSLWRQQARQVRGTQRRLGVVLKRGGREDEHRAPDPEKEPEAPPDASSSGSPARSPSDLRDSSAGSPAAPRRGGFAGGSAPPWPGGSSLAAGGPAPASQYAASDSRDSRDWSPAEDQRAVLQSAHRRSPTLRPRARASCSAQAKRPRPGSYAARPEEEPRGRRCKRRQRSPQGCEASPAAVRWRLSPQSPPGQRSWSEPPTGTLPGPLHRGRHCKPKSAATAARPSTAAAPTARPSAAIDLMGSAAPKRRMKHRAGSNACDSAKGFQ